MKNLYIKQIDVVADEKNNAVPSIIFSEFVNELSDLNEEFSNFREDFKKVWIPKLQGKIIDYLPILEETSYYNIESHLKQYLENINESFLNLFLSKKFKTISKRANNSLDFALEKLTMFSLIKQSKLPSILTRKIFFSSLDFLIMFSN